MVFSQERNIFCDVHRNHGKKLSVQLKEENFLAFLEDIVRNKEKRIKKFEVKLKLSLFFKYFRTGEKTQFYFNI